MKTKKLKLTTKQNDSRGVLKQKLIQVENPSSKLSVLKEMVQIMKTNNGVGLTANQVGLIDRMFIQYIGKKHIEFIINPKIIRVSNDKVGLTEGCLSYPNEQRFVMRYKTIWVKYHNGTKEVSKKLSGMDARVFQHENDHCCGYCILGKDV